MQKAGRRRAPGAYEDGPPFEAPLRQLDQEIAALRESRVKEDLARAHALKRERRALHERLYSDLSPYDRVCLARHPERPVASDYLEHLCNDYLELAGDRRSGDDPAVFAGFATIAERRVVLIANCKGLVGRDRVEHVFGMPKPEGYRKALRAMRLAEKFHLPLVTLIDTPGANPSVEAEDRGQAHAVAENLAAMARLRTPIVSVVIGEGGCGGALAIGVADRVAMLENAYYCVATPEGVAAVLWQSPDGVPEAALAMKLTAQHLHALGIVDQIIAEPFGGAHADKLAAISAVKDAVAEQLDRLMAIPIEELLVLRYEKYRTIGTEP